MTVAVKQVSTLCLNLREGPGVGSRAIMRLPKGTYVALRNASQTVGSDVWVKVQVEHQEGWVNEKLLGQDEIRVTSDEVKRMTIVRGSCSQ